MSGVLPHAHYMQRAIELGKQNPRLPFGALIVDRVTGEILAKGWNRTEINPIWHGEIDAINRLAQARPTIDGTQLVLYTTAESYYPGNKEGHIPTRSASEGPMKSSESRRRSPWDD